MQATCWSGEAAIVRSGARHVFPPRILTSAIPVLLTIVPELQRRCLDRGVFCSLDELTTALEDWIKTWNATARPFRWTKTADQIIDRICRYCSRISGRTSESCCAPGMRASWARAVMTISSVTVSRGIAVESITKWYRAGSAGSHRYRRRT